MAGNKDFPICRRITGYAFPHDENSGFRVYTTGMGFVWPVRGELLLQFETAFQKLEARVKELEGMRIQHELEKKRYCETKSCGWNQGGVCKCPKN